MDKTGVAPAYSPTHSLFSPDIVFGNPRTTRFDVAIHAIGHAETIAHGACRFTARDLQWLVHYKDFTRDVDRKKVNGAVRKLDALGFAQRGKCFWRAMPDLQEYKKAGKVLRGKLLDIGIWLNPEFPDAPASVLTCILSYTGWRNRICFLTQREIAEQTGYGKRSVEKAVSWLLDKRCLRYERHRKLNMGRTGVREVPGYLPDGFGVTRLGGRWETVRNGTARRFLSPYAMVHREFNYRLGELRWSN